MAIVTSAEITRTGLTTQAYWNVYNLINNRSNVKDPHTNGASGKREFVYSREPDLGLGFQGYPLIIIHPVVPAFGRKTIGMTRKEVNWKVLMEVRNNDTFGKERAGIDPRGRGLSQLDSISDEVLSTLNSKSNRETLQTYGMYSVNPEVRSTDTIETENEVVYVREIDLTFNNALMTVSA